MIERRLSVLTVVLAVGLFVAPPLSGAQQAGRVYRIGELRESPPSPAFADAMRGLGWVEGRNLKIHRRIADRRDQLPALAAELVLLRVDLILTAGTPATRAAKEATRTIPIVFSLAGDPVEAGFVSSLARPGWNLTGFTLGLYEEKLLESLKEALPGVSRVAHPLPAGASRARFASLNDAARTLGVELRAIAVRGPADLDRLFAAARRAGAGAVLLPNIAWFRPHLGRIGAAAARSRLPAIGYERAFAESGGLLSYGPTPSQNVSRVAAQVDRILRGARPGDLPVEQPTRFELVVNLKTARVLGLTIPPSVLARAEVIQ